MMIDPTLTRCEGSASPRQADADDRPMSSARSVEGPPSPGPAREAGTGGPSFERWTLLRAPNDCEGFGVYALHELLEWRTGVPFPRAFLDLRFPVPADCDGRGFCRCGCGLVALQ